MIDGKSERGLMNLRKFAKRQMDDYENQDLDDEQLIQRILNIYKGVYSQIFASEDNYIFNTDAIDEYLNLLMKFQKYDEAIESRNLFIQYLKKSGQVDHQIRRAYLEVICLTILQNQNSKHDYLKQIMKQFMLDSPSMNQEEIKIAEQI